jgi:hypothetical protein
VKIILQRGKSSDNSTIGELSIDGTMLCYTLEDVVRPDGEKIPGRTAIPAGTYRLRFVWSEHFKRYMWELTDINGFTYVYFHPGCTEFDTEGCILLGRVKGKDQIYESQLAYREFYNILYVYIKDAMNHIDPITVEIINA